MVRERGLEPPPLTGPDPKSGASAISPLAQTLAYPGVQHPPGLQQPEGGKLSLQFPPDLKIEITMRQEN